MARMKIQVETPGARAAADALLKLSAAERKVALEAAGVQRAMNKTRKATKGASSSMLSGFKQVGGALVGIASGAAAVAASVRLIRSEFDRLKKIDVGAFTAQRTLSDAVGKFLVNNPQTSTAQVAQFQSFAKDAGAQLGAGGGIQAFKALIAVRGMTPGASEEAQAEAVRTAIGLKTMDPDVDIASFAANAIKIQESAKRAGKDVSMAQAFKTLLFTGARAGGDVSQLAKSAIKLTGAEGIATGNDLQDLLSVFAFATAEMGDITGERSATTVAALLGRLQSKPVMIGEGADRMEIERFGATGLDKLLNLVERLRAGEFGDREAEVVRAISEGGGDIQGRGLVGQLVLKLDRFQQTHAAIIAEQSAADVIAEMRDRLEEIVPGARESLAEKEAAGKETAAAEDKSRAGRRAFAMAEIEKLRLTHDIGAFEGPFLGGAGMGHALGKIVDVAGDRRGGVIKEEGQKMVTKALVDRLMEDPGFIHGRGAPRMTSEERSLRMATELEMRKAKTPDELAMIVARRTLGGQDLVHESRGGIDALDTAILRLMGASGVQTNALQLADLSDELLREKLTELIEALRANTGEMGEARLGKTTTSETITTTTPTDAGTVPIDAND